MQIRLASQPDKDAVRRIHLGAFAQGENESIAKLAAALLDHDEGVFSLVAVEDAAIVGHVAFSPVTSRSGQRRIGFILAPLAVLPENQSRGVGSQLVRSGIEECARRHARVILVYGDPRYYGRFGFAAESATRFVPPYPLTYPLGWQAMVLDEAESAQQETLFSVVEPLRDPDFW